MSTLYKSWSALGLLIIAMFFGSALSSDKKAEIDVNKNSVISSDQLGGDERYLLYVSVDKPVYRESESVYLRATILDSSDNTPLANGTANIHVQIKGPKGSVVFDTYANGDDSVAGAKWSIPTGTSGGRYTALVTSPSVGAPQAQRSFEIRAFSIHWLINAHIE